MVLFTLSISDVSLTDADAHHVTYSYMADSGKQMTDVLFLESKFYLSKVDNIVDGKFSEGI